MRRILSIMAVTALALAAVSSSAEGITFYVQLVAGNDSDQPPQSGSKQVGARLAKTFRGFLKWNHYWEVCRQQVEVAPGQAARVRLDNLQQVEIDLKTEGKRIVTLFRGDKTTRQIREPVGESMTIMGGNFDKKSSWFIVVRRDQPG